MGQQKSREYFCRPSSPPSVEPTAIVSDQLHPSSETPGITVLPAQAPSEESDLQDRSFDSIDSTTGEHQVAAPLLLSAPGSSTATAEGRRSIASRRSSNGSQESIGTRDPSALAQTLPKLNTSGCRPPIFLPPSPMSAGTHTGDTIPSVGNLLVSPNIPEWLRRVVDKGIDISTFLHEEYKEIENLEVSRIREGGRGPGHPYSYSVAQQSQNMRRNRYYDIIPYDRSRVVLSSPSPSDKSDYINASHFQGLPGTRPYVVSQGPMESICGDFWQMIWEQKTSLIVMLTNEEERGRVKCHRYVPRTPGQRVQYDNLGGISVTLIEEETMPNGEVVLRRVSLEHGRETRNLWQLHFTAWPDHRASSPQSVLSVLDLSRQLQTLAEKETDAGPMVVHCSAGCGRTGTFCTIDGVLQLLENQSNVHGQDDLVRQTVDKLREQRVSAVQTVEQYAFCYEAVLYRLLEWQHGVGDTRPAWIQLAPTAGPGSDRQ